MSSSPLAENRFAADVLANNQCEAISNINEDERLNPFIDELQTLEVISILAARTSFEGKANGIVVLHQCGDLPRKWLKGEMDLLEAIAAQIGGAIAQAEFSEREKQQREAIEESRKRAEAASSAKGEFSGADESRIANADERYFGIFSVAQHG